MTFRNMLSAVLLGICLLPSAWADEAMTPDKRKAVDEVLATMDIKRLSSQLKEVVLGRWVMQVSRNAPQAISADKSLTDAQKKKLMDNGDKVIKILADDFKKNLDKIDTAKIMQEAMASAYGKSLNEKELHELAVFNSTPTGKKVLQAQAQIGADTMQAAMQSVSEQLKGGHSVPLTEVVKRIDAK